MVTFINDSFSKDYVIPKISKDLDNAGYYLAHIETSDYNNTKDCLIRVYYEPYILKSDQVYVLSNKIYRLVKSKYKQEILNNGFIPRASQREYKYPPRVYFFLEQDWDDFINIYVPTLYDTNSFENPKGQNKVYIFEVDTTKLTDQIFYYDRRYEDYKNRSVWTYDAIPPECITKYMTIWI